MINVVYVVENVRFYLFQWVSWKKKEEEGKIGVVVVFIFC